MNLKKVRDCSIDELIKFCNKALKLNVDAFEFELSRIYVREIPNQKGSMMHYLFLDEEIDLDY